MEWYRKHPEQSLARFLTPDEVSHARYFAGLRALHKAGVPRVWAGPLLDDCLAYSSLGADRISFLLLADRPGFMSIINNWKKGVGTSERGAVVFRIHNETGGKQNWLIRRIKPEDLWLYSYYEAYFFPLCLDDIIDGVRNGEN